MDNMKEKDALILELQNEIADLKVVIVNLTEQLAQKTVKKTSTNSSMAPSHDLTRKIQSRHKKAIKKNGG